MDNLIHLVTLACLYKFVEVVHKTFHVIYDSVPGDHVHVGLAWKLLCGHSGPVLAALEVFQSVVNVVSLLSSP